MKLAIKSLFISMALLVVIAFAGCRLAPLPMSEAETNLKNAGYEVTIVDGTTFADSDENPFLFLVGTELENYLEAKKDDDVIYMYYFYSIDSASDNYTFMSYSNLRSGQNSKLVYFGTKQAITDAGL